MLDAEFIAVGGGLAGAAFAIELARHGREVLVLEGTAGAHHKVCGEFLSTEAGQLLSYLDLDIAALGASSVAILGLAAGGHVATAALPFRAGGLSRYALDEALLGVAAGAGARIERGARVGALELDGDRAVVAHCGTRQFRARAAALATGKHALRGYPRPPSDKVAFKMHLRVGPSTALLMDQRVQLVTFADGYIGACLVENARIALCWVMRDRLIKQIGAGWEEQSSHFSRRAPLLAGLLADARPEWEKPVAVAGVPYGFLRRRAIAPAVYPIGDQLGVIPSYTGDGNAIALHTGIAAARAILAGRDGTAFQADMVARLRPQFRWATAVNLVFEHRWTQRLGIAAAAHVPGLVTRIARSTRLRGFEQEMDRSTPA